jgi:hypothetical protein
VSWLIIDEDGERRILPVEFTDAIDSMTDVAASRGLPLEWPNRARGRVRPTRSCWGYTEDLATPEGKGVMVAAARREARNGVSDQPGYQGQQWAGGSRTGPQVALSAAMHQAVDQIAAANTIAAATRSWLQDDGRRTASAQTTTSACWTQPQGLSVVDGLSVLSATPGSDFPLALRARQASR